MRHLTIRRGVIILCALGVLAGTLAACGKMLPGSPNNATGTLTVHIVMSGTPSPSGAPTQPHPVAATTVTVQVGNGQTSLIAKTDAHGTFTMDLAPGNYWVLEPTLGIYGKVPKKHPVSVQQGQTTTLTITIDTSNNTMPPTT